MSSLEGIYTLPLSKKSALLTQLSNYDDKSISELFKLSSDAASRGANLGTDEIPTEEYLRLVLNFGKTWLLRDITIGTLQAAISVSECRFSRAYNPTLCQINIVTSSQYTAGLVLRDLYNMACSFSLKLDDKLYTATITEIFITCSEWLKAARDAGFVITSVVPMAGLVKGSDKHMSSFILYKELIGTSQVDSIKDLTAVKFKPWNMTKYHNPALECSSPSRQKYPSYLPLRLRLRCIDEVIIIREMREREFRMYYDALQETSRLGIGYGVDELPTYEYFLRWCIDDAFCFVGELANSGKIICYQVFMQSGYSRSQDNNKLFEGHDMVIKEYRCKGVSTEVMQIINSILVDCGCEYVYGDTTSDNIASLKSMTKAGFILTGSIPRTIYYVGKGWMDSVTLYRSMETVKPWSKKLAESKL